MVILGSFYVEIKIFGSSLQLMFMKRSHWKKEEVLHNFFLSSSQFFLVTTNKVSTLFNNLSEL
jgi:hypothetical protein